MAAAVANPVTSAFSTPKAVAPPGQPDISYAPDYDKYQARAARRLQSGNLPTTLPEGFPEQLNGDLVWEGNTLAETYDWTYVLSKDQLAEIDRAVGHFKCQFEFLGSFRCGSKSLIYCFSTWCPYLACFKGHFSPSQAALGTPTSFPRVALRPWILRHQRVESRRAHTRGEYYHLCWPVVPYRFPTRPPGPIQPLRR